MSGGSYHERDWWPTCWKVSEFSDTSPEGLLPAMSGEPSCYWPNSYPFNDQRTRGPRYFTASENTTLKLSEWQLVFLPCQWFSVKNFFKILGPFFWGRQAGGEEAARTKNCQDLIYFMLFQSDRCTFEAPQTPKSFGVPTKVHCILFSFYSSQFESSGHWQFLFRVIFSHERPA